MEKKYDTALLLRAFATRAFEGQQFEIKEYDEAGEIKYGDKTAYIQLYNGHFWDAGGEHGMLQYLGPTAELAALYWIAKERDDCDEFETFRQVDAELLLALYHDDDWAEDDDEENCIEFRVKKYNPEPMQPGIGDWLMKTPEEWQERINAGLDKWEAIGWDEDGKSRRGPAFTEAKGFDLLVSTMQRVFNTRLHHEVYRDEHGEEYACEIFLGKSKETDDWVKAYLVKAGGAYHDTNSGTIMTFLGIDPVIAGKKFCADLDCYLPGEDWDESWDEDWEGPPKTSFEYQWQQDFDRYEGRGGTVYYPAEWQDMITAAQQGMT